MAIFIGSNTSTAVLSNGNVFLITIIFIILSDQLMRYEYFSVHQSVDFLNRYIFSVCYSVLCKISEAVSSGFLECILEGSQYSKKARSGFGVSKISAFFIHGLIVE